MRRQNLGMKIGAAVIGGFVGSVLSGGLCVLYGPAALAWCGVVFAGAFFGSFWGVWVYASMRNNRHSDDMSKEG